MPALSEFSPRIAEALCARLCHELVNPIGSVVNGVETMQDDPAFAAEAAALIAQSAKGAAHRLQFYRLAYGATIGPGEEAARIAVMDFFGDGKITCDWPGSLPPQPPGWIKLAMNLCALSVDCIPRGGTVALKAVAEENGRLLVRASGAGARIPPNLPELLDRDLSDDRIVPRTVQAIFTAALARRLGHEVTVVALPNDAIELRLAPS